MGRRFFFYTNKRPDGTRAVYTLITPPGRHRHVRGKVEGTEPIETKSLSQLINGITVKDSSFRYYMYVTPEWSLRKCGGTEGELRRNDVQLSKMDKLESRLPSKRILDLVLLNTTLMFFRLQGIWFTTFHPSLILDQNLPETSCTSLTCVCLMSLGHPVYVYTYRIILPPLLYPHFRTASTERPFLRSTEDLSLEY